MWNGADILNLISLEMSYMMPGQNRDVICEYKDLKSVNALHLIVYVYTVYVHMCERDHKTQSMSFTRDIKSLLTQSMSELGFTASLSRQWQLSHRHRLQSYTSLPSCTPLTHTLQRERNDHHKPVFLKDAQIRSSKEAHFPSPSWTLTHPGVSRAISNAEAIRHITCLN